MSKPKIIAYLKPSCGWSQGVRAVLRKYDLPFEDRDIINNPLERQEMIEKTGQMLSPCVEINGHMLPDISGEEVEAWMLANNVVTQNDRTPDAPINHPCALSLPAVFSWFSQAGTRFSLSGFRTGKLWNVNKSSPKNLHLCHLTKTGSHVQSQPLTIII